MGSGTLDYKKMPVQNKVFGDKDFFIRPLNLGIKESYKAFIVRPPQTKDEADFKVCIEGEFSTGSEHLKEVKKEYENEIVKFVYFESELNDFHESIREEIKSYCHFAI